MVNRTNPLKAETKYEYVDGLLYAIINAQGTKTKLKYDNAYNLSKIFATNGYEMEWTYDALGNCVKSADSVGNNRRIQFNLLSLPVIINEPDGNVRLKEFDTEGNVTHIMTSGFLTGF